MHTSPGHILLVKVRIIRLKDVSNTRNICGFLTECAISLFYVLIHPVSLVGGCFLNSDSTAPKRGEQSRLDPLGQALGHAYRPQAFTAQTSTQDRVEGGTGEHPAQICDAFSRRLVLPHLMTGGPLRPTQVGGDGGRWCGASWLDRSDRDLRRTRIV